MTKNRRFRQPFLLRMAWAVVGAGLLVAGPSVSGQELVLTENGQTKAVIAVDREARNDPSRALEYRAATELADYIERMSGARPAILVEPAAIATALRGQEPVLVVGELALKRQPELERRLAGAVKKNPFVIGPRSRDGGVRRSDAIVLKRDGSRVWLAGSNSRSHFYAAVRLLNLWGCRWYMPTAFGECVPERPRLTLGSLDETHASPFEIRRYWLAWNASEEGVADFQLRNFMNGEGFVAAHALSRYVKELVPPGGTPIQVPIAEMRTIQHVAAQLADAFAKGGNISLGMDDGVYRSDSKRDAEIQANLRDKYFQSPMLTDNFMIFYNGVARELTARYPQSPATITFLAYGNITIPPQRKCVAEASLVAQLAAIDIDPIHGMDDPRSPPRQEYKAMLYRWADVMQGRISIYDYDQGMLVWRDLPNPSHQAFRQDVKHYRDAGVLGLQTETRGAIATTFLNFFLRGQLMWDPEADVDALLEEFYPAFYGPAAEPMRDYWTAIFRAWEETIVTEHEFYVIPAIYTPSLVETLRAHLERAQQVVAPLRDRDPASLSRNERLVLDRMAFTEKSFALIDLYTAMVRAAATEGDYRRAAELGRRLLAARLDLAAMNPTFTTRVIGPAAEPREPAGSPAWLPGEVKQYEDLAALTEGPRGRLVARLPLEWAFRRDPNDTGLPRGFARMNADLSFWNTHHEPYKDPWSRKDYPTTEWELLRVDLYAQAQGILHPDGQSFTGFMWYKTPVRLDARDGEGPLHLHFPGLFSEAWLYLNGVLVAHRPQHHMWWHNDYAFNWDVDVSGWLKAGENDITLRVHNTHHNGGLFRRPFLYRPTPTEP